MAHLPDSMFEDWEVDPDTGLKWKIKTTASGWKVKHTYNPETGKFSVKKLDADPSPPPKKPKVDFKGTTASVGFYDEVEKVTAQLTEKKEEKVPPTAPKKKPYSFMDAPIYAPQSDHFAGKAVDIETTGGYSKYSISPQQPVNSFSQVEKVVVFLANGNVVESAGVDSVSFQSHYNGKTSVNYVADKSVMLTGGQYQSQNSSGVSADKLLKLEGWLREIERFSFANVPPSMSEQILYMTLKVRKLLSLKPAPEHDHSVKVSNNEVL